MECPGKIGTRKVPLPQANATQRIISGHAGSHLATDIRSERQDSHRFWNSGRSYRATCMLLFSRKRRKMVHCSSYCPIGTLVSFLKYLSPFRVRLTTDCCHCMACTNICRYDALHKEEIEKGKIGYTCTYCGDCLSACKHGAIEYHFPGLRPATAERLWIVVTVVLHTCFLMIARI